MTIADVADRTSRQGNWTYDCAGAHIRAHCRHLATVVTVRGDIDAVNIDEVGRYLQRFILEDHPVVLDLSEVDYFSGAAISLLHMLDENCHAAGVQWSLVASPAVRQLLGDDRGDALFPLTGSVHEALRDLADAIVSRRQLVLPLIRKTA